MIFTGENHQKIVFSLKDEPVFHEDEVKDGVEARHHQVGEAQVHQEVVGHVLHPAMACEWNCHLYYQCVGKASVRSYQ